jgi:hypothetical protein
MPVTYVVMVVERTPLRSQKRLREPGVKVEVNRVKIRLVCSFATAEMATSSGSTIAAHLMRHPPLPGRSSTQHRS